MIGKRVQGGGGGEQGHLQRVGHGEAEAPAALLAAAAVVLQEDAAQAFLHPRAGKTCNREKRKSVGVAGGRISPRIGSEPGIFLA